MDWDDLPRLAAMGRDGPDPFTYDDLSRVIESQYTLGVVCATPTGPVGYMVYVVSDGTGKSARKSGKLHLAAGLVRLVVDPQMRRQGVGRFLVDKIAEALVHQFGQRAASGRLRLHQSGNTPAFKFTFSVTDGPYKNRKVFERLFLTEKANARVLLFANRLELISESEFGKESVRKSWSAAVGKKVVIEVEEREYDKKDGSKGKASNLAFGGIFKLSDPKVADVVKGAVLTPAGADAAKTQAAFDDL